MLSDLEKETREVHASVCELRSKLRRAQSGGTSGARLQSSGGETLDGEAGDGAERVAWGHELRDVDMEMEVSLDEILAKR